MSEWHQRWAEGRIGFHEGVPNDLLVAHADRFTGRERVLVPLCGKTDDLAYLARAGHDVVGVELVEDAVRAFFAEHAMPPTVTPRAAFTEYVFGAIRVLAGDWFATSRELIGPIDAIYDRAALIALPPELRVHYAAHLRSLAPAGTPMLVITLEYPQEQQPGPPFAVLEDELRTLYAGAASIELLADRVAKGRVANARERCFGVVL